MATRSRAWTSDPIQLAEDRAKRDCSHQLSGNGVSWDTMNT